MESWCFYARVFDKPCRIYRELSRGTTERGVDSGRMDLPYQVKPSRSVSSHLMQIYRMILMPAHVRHQEMESIFTNCMEGLGITCPTTFHRYRETLGSKKD